jgi:threonine/homoserine/homoserine lactone efflux protein
MTEYTFLISGIVFGLAAGISPGPLLTLVISETLKHSRKEGVLVASAPLLTDIPIVLLSLFVISKVSHSDSILGVIAVVGALFIGYLGWQSLTMKKLQSGQETVKPQSLKKGVIANLLSPHPYMFWISVGAPTVFKAYRVSIISAVSFVAVFYALLVGSKIIIAVLTDKSKEVLKNDVYVIVIKLLGIVLFIFSILFLKDAFELFGIF